jgi:hypothetical protein
MAYSRRATGAISIRALACSFATLGCGARTNLGAFGDAGTLAASQEDVSTATAEPDASTEDSPTGTPLQGGVHALLVNECGPADGLARTFIVAPTPLQCPATNCTAAGCLPPRPPTHDEISLYHLSRGAIGATISAPVTGPNGEGEARSCRNGMCVPATSFFVSFLLAAGTGTMTGMYTLTFADGSTVSGSLYGAVCDNQMFCG